MPVNKYALLFEDALKETLKHPGEYKLLGTPRMYEILNAFNEAMKQAIPTDGVDECLLAKGTSSDEAYEHLVAIGMSRPAQEETAEPVVADTNKSALERCLGADGSISEALPGLFNSFLIPPLPSKHAQSERDANSKLDLDDENLLGKLHLVPPENMEYWIIPDITGYVPEEGSQRLTPIVKLLGMYYQDHISTALFLKAMQLLLDGGTNALEVSTPYWTHGTFYYVRPQKAAMSHIAEMLKCVLTREKMDGLCRAAEMLHDKGAVIRLGHDCMWVDNMSLDDHDWIPDWDEFPRNAIEIALMPHCSPTFLERFFASWGDAACGKLLKSLCLRGSFHSNMGRIISRIYRDVFDKANTRGYSSPLEITHLLERKVEILTHWEEGYDRLDNAERAALTGLAGAVREIQEALLLDGDRGETFAAQSWFKMCMTAKPLHDGRYECDLPLQNQAIHQFYWRRRRPGDPRYTWICWHRYPDVVPRLAEEEFRNFWYDLVIKKSGERDWENVSNSDQWFVSMTDALVAYQAYVAKQPRKPAIWV